MHSWARDALSFGRVRVPIMATISGEERAECGGLRQMSVQSTRTQAARHQHGNTGHFGRNLRTLQDGKSKCPPPHERRQAWGRRGSLGNGCTRAEFSHRCGLKSLRACDDIEFDALTFIQGTKPRTLDT